MRLFMLGIAMLGGCDSYPIPRSTNNIREIVREEVGRVVVSGHPWDIRISADGGRDWCVNTPDGGTVRCLDAYELPERCR